MAKHKSKRRDKKQALSRKIDVLRNTISEIAGSGRFRAIAAFALSCIGFYALILALPQSFTKPINEHTAYVLGLVLNSFGIPALTAGDVVSEKGLAFQIIPECTPIFTAGLFVSFVAFHPASILQKATGLAWGIPALYLGNLFRLAATFAISRYDSRLFDVTHVYLGQVFTKLLVIL
jgi:exosortase H (IPTLxxWG-CTERM-specific)